MDETERLKARIEALEAALWDILENARFDCGPDGTFPLEFETQRAVDQARALLTPSESPSDQPPAGSSRS